MNCAALSKPWPTVAVTAALTATLALPLRKLLHRWGAVDVPNHRSSHSAPTPRGGGVAGLIAAGATTLLGGRKPEPRRGIAALALSGVGLADDIRGHVPIEARLGAQLALGASR